MTILVSICIATYKRPQGLSDLLQGLNQLTFEKVPTPNLEVILVDNDASTWSAKPIYETSKLDFRWPLRYFEEPQKGVSYARNKTIKSASDETDFFVLIDDDEQLSPQWLDELLYVQDKYSADIVTGPVYPRFQDDSTPDWIKAGGFFDPPQRETGEGCEIAFTNNVLIKADLLRPLDLPFNPEFALRGAEDVHLFMFLHQQGAKIVWAQDAVVYETIGPERTCLQWLLKRAYYGWSSHSLLERKFYPSPATQILRAVKGLVLLMIGLVTVVPAFLISKFFSQLLLAKSLLYLYRGLGTFSGLLGRQGAWGGANR